MIQPLLKDRTIAFFIALAFHAAILFSGERGLIQKAEFGMGSSNEGYAVDLIAALPDELNHIASSETSQETTSNFKDDLITPDLEKKDSNLILNSSIKPIGDGSSPIPGNDAIARVGGNGGETPSRPGYYKNPPPYYPEEAKRLGQQGLVILNVIVNNKGKAKSVNLELSAGYHLLDESAVQAVKSWRFKPAMISGVPIESEVEVPIRFKLEDSEKHH